MISLPYIHTAVYPAVFLLSFLGLGLGQDSRGRVGTHLTLFHLQPVSGILHRDLIYRKGRIEV